MSERKTLAQENGNKGIPFKKVLRSDSFSVLMIIAVMLAVILPLKPDYLSYNNIVTLVRVFAITALVGFSQMIIIASGGMNVSVGSIGALCAIMAGLMLDTYRVAVVPVVIITLAFGVLCGLINGLLIYRAGGVGVASFLTTLATSSVFTGINLTITEGKPFYNIPESFLKIGDTQFLGLPTSLYIMLAFALLIGYGFRKLTIGKQILAFGGNHKAAELYGVSKKKVVIVSHMLGGFLSALAGMLVVIRIKAAQPDIGGDWMLTSFAAPLIGGTLLSGGKVNVAGCVLGAVVLTLVTNALVHLKVDVYWNQLINGLIILLAVTLDRVRHIERRRVRHA